MASIVESKMSVIVPIKVARHSNQSYLLVEDIKEIGLIAGP